MSDQMFPAQLAEVQMFERELTAEEVQDLYDGKEVPGRKVYWKAGTALEGVLD